jgi:hypothetical protein
MRQNPANINEHQIDPKIDDRLLAHRSDLILCSRCLRQGVRTPVVQIISARHRLLPLCRHCRDNRPGRANP